EVSERLLQLAQVLDRVLSLPERALPVRPGGRAGAGDAGPVRLPELAPQRADEGLRRAGCHGRPSVRRRGGLAPRGRGGIEGLHVHVMSGPTTRTRTRVARAEPLVPEGPGMAGGFARGRQRSHPAQLPRVRRARASAWTPRPMTR